VAKRFKQKEIDDLMEDIPTLPKKFGDFMMETPFNDMNYMFYKRKHKKTYGLCSKCSALSVFESDKYHNDIGRCPSCKTKVTYKAINKAKSYIDDNIVTIIQKMGEGLIIRYFKVRRVFKSVNDNTEYFPQVVLKTLREPEQSYYEGSRVYINLSKRGNTEFRSFEKEWDWRSGEIRWVNERIRGGLNNKELLRASDPFLYKRNLKVVLKNTKWKYSGLDYFKGKNMNIDDYLKTYERHPAIEMLSKLNYQVLLQQIIYRSCWWHGVGGILKMDKKCLGLSSQVFNTGKRLKLNIEGLEFVSTLEECNKTLSDKQIVWAVKNVDTETFVQVLKWVPAQKIINYIEKQEKINSVKDLQDKAQKKTSLLVLWRDYLEMRSTLGLDVKDGFVLSPRELKEKHDECSLMVETKINEQIDKGIKEQYKKWNEKLFFESKSLRIEVASSHDLIIKEGKVQEHCVGRGRYSKEMAEGRSLILFIKKDNKPHCTVQFNPHTMAVIQNRAFDNKSPSKEVEKFIKKWKIKKLALLNKVESKAI